jgi:putative transposase
MAVVMDLFSRRIVGWAMASHMQTSLICDALNMALQQRKPPRGLLLHSDRGSQYASHEYQVLLKRRRPPGIE